MSPVARRVAFKNALPLGCTLAALWPSGASASDLRLFTPDTLEVSGDVRLVAVDGEEGWLDGGFGKLRSGSNNDWKVKPELGNVNLVWQPQFGWSLSATIVGSIDGGERTQAGLSQAYLSYRPMRSSNGTSFAARAGLMWPPVSLEHEGADWHVADSITPSAINSWIAEEVRPVAVEGTISANLGPSKLRATAALFAANDTAGTLLTFRGWALHDRTTLAFNRWPLPALGDDLTGVQAPFTHPLLDVHSGFAHRPGYYAKISWQAPFPLRVELFRYDNRANPEDMNAELEWGWNTQFDNLGIVAKLGGGTELKAQALEGRTRMGFPEGGRRWIDNSFHSAFVMLSRPFGPYGLAVRAEAFGTHNRGSLRTDEYDEHGWSAMLAAKREFGPVTGLLELLHVMSDSPAREDSGEEPGQQQTEIQAEIRMDW